MQQNNRYSSKLFNTFGFCFFFLVFATNFRVKAAMKNSVLLSWEIRDKNPAQPFTVSKDWPVCMFH